MEDSSLQSDDTKLLKSALSGDRAAAEEFVRRFSDLIYKCVQFTLLNKNVPHTKEDLEDIHNTIFLQLFENNCKKLNQFAGKNGCSLPTWLRVVSVRIVLNHLREKNIGSLGCSIGKITLDQLPELGADEHGPFENLENADKVRLLNQGLLSMSDRDRRFMQLHYEKGLSAAETAAALQVSTKNLYTIKHRAIERLKHYLSTL